MSDPLSSLLHCTALCRGEYFAGLEPCAMYPILALPADIRGWAGLKGGPKKARFSGGNVRFMANAGGAGAARPRPGPTAAGPRVTLRFHSSGGSGRALWCPAAMTCEATDDGWLWNMKASSTEPMGLLEAASHGDSGL